MGLVCARQAPFNEDGGKLLLGKLDLAFLGAYAVGMFGAGHLGDRIHLRKFLTFGMLASGAMVCSVGLAYFLDIHSIWYFVMVQIIGGVHFASLKLLIRQFTHIAGRGLFLQAHKSEDIMPLLQF